MSLYHYVANKDELLDAMIDVVFEEIELPPDETRLAVGDAAGGGIRSTGSRTPPLGDRLDGVANITGACESAAPRSGHRAAFEGLASHR